MSKKPRKRLRQKFYISCVKYLKRRNGGSIHPQNTSYAIMASMLEDMAGIDRIELSDLERCKRAARSLGFANTILSRTKTQEIQFPRAIRKDFYSSMEWKRLRYDTLRRYGAVCVVCGRDSSYGTLHVDHIKPVSKFWDLRLDPDNLQVMCGDCNMGKGNRDSIDWR